MILNLIFKPSGSAPKSIENLWRGLRWESAPAPQSMVQRAYDRAQFLDEWKKMMQHWSDYLDSIATGKVIVGDFKKRA